MNKQEKYNQDASTYLEIENNYLEEKKKFEEWALKSAKTHLSNGNLILRKYNRARWSQTQRHINTETLPWHYPLTFKNFTEDGLVFTYTGPTNATYGPKTAVKEFVFKKEWLSLSIWEFNKRVREDLKKQIAKDDKALAEENTKKLNEKKALIAKKKKELNDLEDDYNKAYNDTNKWGIKVA